MSPAPPTLAPGTKLDRYEILCPIAQGGMGECWLGRLHGKHGFSRLVAIKAMKAEYADDPGFRSMFLDEARIASRIEHPNVAQILDLGDEDGQLFLVMEYVDGESLLKVRREAMRRSSELPIGITLRILADALGGLHAAHELTGPGGVPLGVVHRDVSPQNILVGMRGVTKLIDFGIAKARDRTSSDTTAGTLKGKLQFMAPEQALGLAVDRRADVFAIGALAYFLLSGRYAFHGETAAAMVSALASGHPPEPLPARVPAAVASAVHRALAHDPAARFASAAEMQDALESAMAKTGHATSTSAVARFLEPHLGERARARQTNVEHAIAVFERAVEPPSFPPLHTDPGSLTESPTIIDRMPPPRRALSIAGACAAAAVVALGVATGVVVRAQRRPAPTIAPAAPPVVEPPHPVAVPAPAPAPDEPATATTPVVDASASAIPPAPRAKPRPRRDYGF